MTALAVVPDLPPQAPACSMVEVVETTACSFCPEPVAFVFIDRHTDHAPLTACRSHLLEAFEWVTS